MKINEFSNSDQNHLLDQVNDVKQLLLQLPNVITVGLGIKESNNEFTDDISFKVFVSHKVDIATLAPDEMIPKSINGIKTDVIIPYQIEKRLEVCGTEREKIKSYRPLKAGIPISYGDEQDYGTLGWFAQLDEDDSIVILSNEHVLSSTVDKKIGQPGANPSKCCCCECCTESIIAHTVVGVSNATVDCAIAKLNAEFVASTVFEISNDSSPQVLTVASPPTAAAVVGNPVKKIGARSGYTEGIVVHIGDAAVAATDSGGTTITIQPNQVLIKPAPTETYQIRGGGICKAAFSADGDSGSVILNSSNQIVGLLYSGDSITNNVDITFANNINNVLSAFATAGKAITILSSPAGGRKRTPAQAPTTQNASAENLTTELEELRNTNKNSILYSLYEKHHREVLNLINHNRAVGVTWQRGQGPAYVAAIARAGKEKTYDIPSEIEGITRETLLLKMETVLNEQGSEALKNDIKTYRTEVLKAFAKGQSIRKIAENLLKARLIDDIPGFFLPNP